MPSSGHGRPVAVIGLGVIGRAEAAMFGRARPLVTYDPAEGRPYPEAEITGCEYAVICAGTPESPDGSAYLGHVLDAVADLPARMPVLLRSTVPPGTTDRLVADRGLGRGVIAHAPEFMHERPGGAWGTPEDVPFMILGGTPQARAWFAPYLGDVFPGKIHQCDAVTAELAKYTINLHLATRITFINEMDQICRRFGADWEEVRAAWLNDPRITPEYTGGISEFGPGYGGRCWPKDMAALIAAAGDAGYDAGFLKAVRDANDRFRA